MTDYSEQTEDLLRLHRRVSDRLIAAQERMSEVAWRYNMDMLNAIERQLDRIKRREYVETWPLRIVRRDRD